jgi:S-DNA-T family DNA segregation ATPase FtsK/SpoIIIE
VFSFSWLFKKKENKITSSNPLRREKNKKQWWKREKDNVVVDVDWDVGEDDVDNETDEDEDDDHTHVLPREKSKPGKQIIKKEEDGIEIEIDVPAGDDASDDPDLLGLYDPRLDLSNYRFPTVDLLMKYSQSDIPVNMDEQTDNQRRIKQTLEDFGINIVSIKATVGPTVTLYEVVPAVGVRIARIRNLEDDIALRLSALGIRIIAPMPGKGTIGIEVPNKEPQTVSMHSIIVSRKFVESKHELPIALGRTITNEVFMFDLCDAPHLLMAGSTGQGKSVGLNTIITSLLYKKHPAELKFVLVDVKMVEFSVYADIEHHYLAKLPDEEKAIITDYTKVVNTLNSLCVEMENRYELLTKAHVRNVKDYNEKFMSRRLNPEKGHKYIPYIVVIIDEFAELIMTAGKDIEMPIARIAQKARAVGIHMIIATQRPSTNIITGTIKANFPLRIAFRVITMIDSRTILDTPGANQLVGRGDLLYYKGSDMIRVQCAFIDGPEVENIAAFIGKQPGYDTAYQLPEFIPDGEGEKSPGSVDLSDRDPLFDEAAHLIVIHQQGSTSLIQRKFSIGYNRAGRLMDQLEAAGIVGPGEGSKARQVLILDEYSLERKLAILK